jgi:hypothetical protein
VAELKNEFSWSFSRHRELEDCPRRAYYRRHGAWGGWSADADERSRELYRLSKLEHRPMWMGKAVHDAIARALWRAREGEPVVSEEDRSEFLQDLLHGMRADFKDSREDRARLTGRFKDHVRFAEHELGLDDGSPRWRRFWKDTAEAAELGLSNFLRSRIHAELRDLAADDWIELERPSSGAPEPFELDGLRVYAKIDCAYRSGGRPTLVDWKTGRRLTPATGTQLAVYALYLQARYGIDPAELRAREVNVVTGETADHDVSPAALEDFRMFFRESVDWMFSFLSEPAENRPKPEEDWPFTRDERRCGRCEFRSACARFAGQGS